MCRLIKKHVEYNDPAPSPNFEYPVYGTKEEECDEIPEEVSRFLEREEKSFQPYKESLETINLGSEEEPKEVKIRALLHPDIKRKLTKLLKEYVDIFCLFLPRYAWFRYRYFRAPFSAEAKVPANQTKVTKNSPRHGGKNQRRSSKIDQCRFSCDISVPLVDFQYCPSTKER